jgi:hypothetical protein
MKIPIILNYCKIRWFLHLLYYEFYHTYMIKEILRKGFHLYPIDTFLGKPVSPDRFIAEIENLLE